MRAATWQVPSCGNPGCTYTGGEVDGEEQNENLYEIGFDFTCRGCGMEGYAEIPGPLGDWDDWSAGVRRTYPGTGS